MHSFEHEGVQKVTLPLKGKFEVVDKYETGDHKIAVTGSELIMEFYEAFDAVAVLLK